MSDVEYTPFDFRKAGTTDFVVRTLKSWLAKSEGTFTDSWDAVASTTASMHCETVLSRTFEEGVRSVGSTCVGYAILLGAEKTPSLVCIPNKDVIALVGCMVGGNIDSENEERKLTSIEISLCRLLFETFGSALGIAFTGSEPLEIELGEFDDSPQLSRLIPVKELVLCTKIEVRVVDTSIAVTWLLPRKPAEALFERATGNRLDRKVNNPFDVVMHIPLDLVGILGRTEMSMESVTELEVGDILVLDQKINEPITVEVDEHELFQCWPGRVGDQQGLEIINVI